MSRSQDHAHEIGRQPPESSPSRRPAAPRGLTTSERIVERVALFAALMKTLRPRGRALRRRMGVPLAEILWVSLLLIPVAGRAAPLADGSPFVNGELYAVQRQATGIAVGDFDHDGDPDIAVAETPPARVTLWWNDGRGTFASGAGDSLEGAHGDVTAADLDGDGAVDIVTTAADGVFLVRSSGARHFAPPQRLLDVHASETCRVADLNHDGLADVVFLVGDSICFASGRRDGVAAPICLVRTAEMARHLTIADFDADGVSDIAVTVPAPSEGWHSKYALRIFLNDGHGRFVPLDQGVCDGNPVSVDAADLDGDGAAELIIGCWGQGISRFWNDSRGHFKADTPQLAVWWSEMSVALADFDGDGHMDIAANGTDNWLGGRVVVWSGLGWRAFDAPETFAFGYRPERQGSAQELVPVDIDHDGDLDLLGLWSNPSWSGAASPSLVVLRHGANRTLSLPRLAAIPWQNFGGFATALPLANGAQSDIVMSDEAGIRLIHVTPTGAIEARPGPPLRGPVTVVDLDRDGRKDFVETLDGSLALHFSRADGSLSLPETLSVSHFLCAGDLDGDRRPELVCVDATGHICIVFRDAAGQHRYLLQCEPGPKSDSPTIGVGDFDADRRDELVVTRFVEALEGYALVVLNWDPADGLTESYRVPIPKPEVDYRYHYYPPRELVVSDLDGDDRSDLVVLMSDSEHGYVTTFESGADSRLKSNGDITPAGHEFVANLTAADVDGDGDMDLASTSFWEGYIPQLGVLINDGGGNYDDWWGEFLPGEGPQNLVAGDFNGDGAIDIAATMHWYSGVAATQGGMNIYYGRPRAADPTLAVGSVPGARTFSGLALSSVFPNPARGDLTVRYALADRSAADLEMLDVTGRRVARQALATTVNGAGEARFRVGSDVRAGIYWLRLSQAGRSTSTKLAVVR